MDRAYAEKTLKEWGLWHFRTLQEVKESLKFSSSNSKGKLMWDAIQLPEDCFGRDYDANSEECKSCTAHASLGGLIDELRLVCVAVVWLLRLKNQDVIQPDQCFCGCGKPLRSKQRYIKDHFWQGKHFSDTHKQRLSEAQPNKKMMAR